MSSSLFDDSNAQRDCCDRSADGNCLGRRVKPISGVVAAAAGKGVHRDMVENCFVQRPRSLPSRVTGVARSFESLG